MDRKFEKIVPFRTPVSIVIGRKWNCENDSWSLGWDLNLRPPELKQECWPLNYDVGCCGFIWCVCVKCHFIWYQLIDLTLRFASMPSMCNVSYYSLIFLYWHYMFRPKQPSLGVQVFVIKESTAHCNTVLFLLRRFLNLNKLYIWRWPFGPKHVMSIKKNNEWIVIDVAHGWHKRKMQSQIYAEQQDAAI
jgi:hypothetical protein